jgi:hypothetical protein
MGKSWIGCHYKLEGFFVTKSYVSQHHGWSLMWSLVEIPPVAWPMKAGKDFSIYGSEGYFVQRSETCQYCAQLRIILITPVKFGWNLTSSLTCQGRTRFSILSFRDHFVQRSGTCPWCAQQGMVLITSVKFGWNPTSSLTCEGWTRFFYF